MFIIVKFFILWLRAGGASLSVAERRATNREGEASGGATQKKSELSAQKPTVFAPTPQK